ncbi:MAG: urease accessory protein UreD, partial [Pseudomonadota bacterium]
MSLDALQIERRIAIARQPRAIGEGVVSARRRGAVSAIGALRQSGSAKILFPHRSRETLEAVLLNTAGGVTGGDRFAWRATAEAGAALALSTQAAERAYRAQPGERAEVSTTLTVEAGATLLWAPQE